MSNLRVTPINAWDDAVLSSSPALPALSPLSFSQTVTRDAAAISSGPGDLVIDGHWNGNGRRLSSFHLFRHNAHGGLLRLQLFDNMDRTSENYNSGALEVYPLTAIEAEWGVAPLGFSSSDVLGPESPFWIYFAEKTALSFRLTLTRCQNINWTLGRPFMGRYLEAPYNPEHGMTFGWQSTGQQQRTLDASLRTRPGSRFRELKADMFFATDADRALWRDLLGQIDLHEDVAISIAPDYGGMVERNGVFNAQLQEHSPFRWANPAFHETILTFAEV